MPPEPVRTKELIEPFANSLTNLLINSKRSTTEKGHFGASTKGLAIVGARYFVTVTGPFNWFLVLRKPAFGTPLGIKNSC
jgi:hypothetical protein